MCLRPDIVYVITQPIHDDWKAFIEKTGLHGDTVGFNNHWTALIKAAEEGNEQQAAHWRLVQDFGKRMACSPLSGIEIDGKIEREFVIEENHWSLEPENIIKIYIGNPLNPPHVPDQPAITQESMKAIAAAYQSNARP